MSAKTIQCLEELRDKAQYCDKHGVIHVLDTDAAVVKSDLEDTDRFWSTIIECVRPLEQVPDHRKDWHPGTGGLVLDLLHPSLFPLQYGKTRILPRGKVPLLTCSEDIGRGETCAVPAAVHNEHWHARKGPWGDTKNLKPWGSYQWLPSDIVFRQDGTAQVLATSTIYTLSSMKACTRHSKWLSTKLCPCGTTVCLCSMRL